MGKKSAFSAEYKRLCAILREARRAAGLTQQEVARQLGQPQSFISKYEAGERRLDVIEFLEITKALRVPAARMLSQLKKDS